MKHTLSELEASGNKFALVKINETRFWREDIAKKAGEIYGYYLVNLTEPTNLCSFEVNFPAQWLYNRVKNTAHFTEDEHTEIEYLPEEGYPYFLESDTFEVVKTWNESVYAGTDEADMENEIVEYLQGNPIE